MNNPVFNKRTLLLLFVIFLVSLTGCNNDQGNTQSEVIGNPTPKDFLEDGNADIFMLGGIVYSNVEHVDWVKELDYELRSWRNYKENRQSGRL